MRNTNALIAMHAAKDVPNERFTAMTRLDQNRAAGAARGEGRRRHRRRGATCSSGATTRRPRSPTSRTAWIGGKSAAEVITDHDWLKGDFFTTVQKRGAAIIAAPWPLQRRRRTDLVDHVRDLSVATEDGGWRSAACRPMASYGVPEAHLVLPREERRRGGYEINQGLGNSATSARTSSPPASRSSSRSVTPSRSPRLSPMAAAVRRGAGSRLATPAPRAWILARASFFVPFGIGVVLMALAYFGIKRHRVRPRAPGPSRPARGDRRDLRLPAQDLRRALVPGRATRRGRRGGTLDAQSAVGGVDGLRRIR